MKGKVHISIVLVVSIMLVFASGANAYNPVAAGEVTPIPWAGLTSLPDYIGAPAKAHPTATRGSAGPFWRQTRLPMPTRTSG
jgi:hypothetical protein